MLLDYGVKAPVSQSGYLARRFDRIPSLAIANLLRGDDERLGSPRHAPVGRFVRHYGPQNAGHLVGLVGQSDTGQFPRTAVQQFQQQGIGCLVLRLGVPDYRGGTEHQQLLDPLIASATDAPQPLSAAGDASAQ